MRKKKTTGYPQQQQCNLHHFHIDTKIKLDFYRFTRCIICGAEVGRRVAIHESPSGGNFVPATGATGNISVFKKLLRNHQEHFRTQAVATLPSHQCHWKYLKQEFSKNFQEIIKNILEHKRWQLCPPGRTIHVSPQAWLAGSKKIPTFLGQLNFSKS